MKAKIRKTGEVVDVICYNGYTERLSTDSVSYIDSNGREVARENLNFYWDFEPIEPTETNTNKGIDWEQRRYEIAKAAMLGMMTNIPGDSFCHVQAKECVEIADELIKELKG